MLEPLEVRILMASFSVTSLADTGPGSLREAITLAADNDTIDMTALSGTIALQSELCVAKDLNFTGPGVSALSITGSSYLTRAFNITGARHVAMSNFTISDAGTANDDGGAIDFASNASSYVDASLTLDRMEISHNRAKSAGGAIRISDAILKVKQSDFFSNYAGYGATTQGGAIWINAGKLQIDSSTFTYNLANAMMEPQPGGDGSVWTASARGGAIYASDIVGAVITRSTMTFNSAGIYLGRGPNPSDYATAEGGALMMTMLGNVSISGSTIANNKTTFSGPNSNGQSSCRGGGVSLVNALNAFWANVNNTVIAGNAAWSDPDVYLDRVFTPGRGNLIGAFDGGEFSGEAGQNIIGTTANPIDPMLGPVASNGGPTKTRLPLAGSPLINAGLADNPSFRDQRGYTRPDAPDIGAAEYNGVAPQQLTITSTPPPAITVDEDFSYRLEPAGGIEETRIISASPLPVWLNITYGPDGTATLSGRPATQDIGTVEVTLKVSDETYSTQQALTLAVVAPEPIRIKNGVLTLIGTDAGDYIQAWVPRTNAGQVRVIYNDRVVNFSRSSITGLSIDGRAGDDVIYGNTPFGATVVGGAGNDSLAGGGGDDTIFGGDGDDNLDGNAGDDVLRGEEGIDRLDGGGGADLLYGGNGSDRLVGGIGRDLLDAGTGRDWIFAKDADRDTIIGDGSKDLAYADLEDLISGISTVL